MEDIYDDLSNYEDVNAVEELRNENKELKVKLEEHAAAMEKLQRDYDTLEMEFKKLENNYSSLLKTARSEIERKNQRISQLNLEKDTMVLDALKRGQKIRRHFNKGIQEKSQGNNEKPNLPSERTETSYKEYDVKQKNTRTDRFEPTARHTKDLITDTNNRNKFESASARDEHCTSRNTNVVHKKTELNEPPKVQASSIRNRRKSMPAACMPVDQFSSDEENKQNYHAKDTRPHHPLLERFDRRNSNKLPVDRHSNKTSETSSFDDRGNNYHEYSSRDCYKGRPIRNTASSSYRGRDKYEMSLKHRKQYSPDRGMKRKYREHHDDYQRYERGRHQVRSLESPPPEIYSRHSRRNPEPRSLSDSRYAHDHDKYTHRHEDKYFSKSKLSMDYDEPQSKRLRSESFGKPDAHSREDRRYYNEKESMEAYRTPEFSPHEYESHRYSCQSPDLVHTDAASAEPIEIKTATTSTPIQDPRLADSKYIVRQENGTETISTTVGRNIDLIPVDKSKWNSTPVDIPCALLQRPSEYRDEIVKEIYMDIDSPNADTYSATESIPYSSNDGCNENLYATEDFAVRQEETDFISKQATDAPIKDSQNINKYRIPKIGQDKTNARSKMDVPIIDLGVIEPQITSTHKKIAETDVRIESIHSQESRDRGDDVHHMNKHYDSMEEKIRSQKQRANIAIVADDLELSDDNSDHLDTNRHTVAKKYQNTHNTVQLNIKDVSYEVSVQKIDRDSSKTSSSPDSVELHNIGDVKNKEADYSRKHNSKLNNKDVRCEDSVHKIDKDPSKTPPSFEAVKEIKNKEADNTRKHKSKLNTKEIKCEDSVHKIDKDATKMSLSFDFVDLHNVDDVQNKDADCARKHRSKINTKEVKCEDSVRKTAKDSSQRSSSIDFVDLHNVDSVKNKDADSARKHRSKPNTKEVRCEDSVRKTAKDSSQTSPSIEFVDSHNVNDIKNRNADSARKHRSKPNTKEVGCEDSVRKTAKDSSQISPSTDFVDLHNVDEVKNKDADCARKHRSKPNTKEVRCEASVQKTAKDSCRTSPSLDIVEVNDAEEVKNKEADGTKKHKSKKKKSQSKSKESTKDSIETTDAIHVPEKKVKSKKEKESKPKETKETFSALFGDSSSLMTPEDLGIPTYVPISEDAQDSVDIKIDRIIDAPPLLDEEFPVNIHKENAVEITKEAAVTHNDEPRDVPQNCNIKQKEVFKETKTKKAPKKKERIMDTNELPSPVLYENMNPGTDSNEPLDVVKTVVISSGKQPEVEFDNRELTVTPTADIVRNEEQTAAVPALKEFKRLDMLKALATSTPQKDFPISNPMVTDVINTNSNKPVEQEVKENGGNTLETQDAPDVRIFVKRRRKLAKRPPMT